MNTLAIDANWMPLSKVDVPLLPHREVELTAQRTVIAGRENVTVIEWTRRKCVPLDGQAFEMRLEWVET